MVLIDLNHMTTLQMFTVCLIISTAALQRLPDPTQATRNRKQDASTDQVGLMDCNKTEFTAVLANVPPYGFILPDSYTGSHEIRGAVHVMLTQALGVCCGSFQLNVSKVVPKLRKVEEEIGSEDVGYPVVKSALMISTGLTAGYIFLPVMETAGSVLMVKTEASAESVVGSSLLGCWPLAIIVISTAGLAGIFMWILDHAQNSDDFPRSFIKGGWEGTWWAFVTMTTVGYGDRAPKSVPARILGLIWMVMGIILMSIFTATLTTALSVDQSSNVEIKGLEVGVLSGSMEEIVAYKEGASVKAFEFIGDLLNAVSNETADTILMDINFALYQSYNKFEKLGLTLGRMVENRAAIGIIVNNQSRDVEQCLAKQVSKSQFKVYDKMVDFRGRFKRLPGTIAAQTTSHVLASMYLICIVMLGLWVTTFIMCLIWEFAYFRPLLRREGLKVADSHDITVDSISREKIDNINNSRFPFNKQAFT